MQLHNGTEHDGNVSFCYSDFAQHDKMLLGYVTLSDATQTVVFGLITII
jgi:hypothetical protein